MGARAWDYACIAPPDTGARVGHHSHHRLKAEIGDLTIDVLINNAGILHSYKFGSLNYDDMLQQYRINTLGPLRITEALRENLAAGSKVAIVTSRVGSIADNSSGGYYGYRASKTALNQVGVNLMHNLNMENTGGFWHAEGYELPW